MMNRIINTMFHGSTKARIFLWSVFIMGLATILLGVMAAALGSFTFGTGAFVCGLAAFVTSQSASLTEMERRDKQEKKKTGRKRQRSRPAEMILPGSQKKRMTGERMSGILRRKRRQKCSIFLL